MLLVCPTYIIEENESDTQAVNGRVGPKVQTSAPCLVICTLKRLISGLGCRVMRLGLRVNAALSVHLHQLFLICNLHFFRIKGGGEDNGDMGD